MIPNVARALACARYLRTLGLTPLPSRSDDKIPDLMQYTQFYTGEPVPEDVYDNWKAANIQVIMGTKHPGTLNIMTVDLDGDEAYDAWKRICDRNQYQPTSPWMTRTGSGGTHLCYRLPEMTNECASGIIWGIYDTFGKDGRGEWLKHKEIRILADRSLMMFPPSFHPSTGVRYTFYPGMSPNEIGLPEVAPSWLLAMPRLVSPRFATSQDSHVIRKPEKLSGRHYMRNEVLSAIDKKVDLLKSWGLRTATDKTNPSGWVACYVPWREDPSKSRPSGSLHEQDGTFQDRHDNRSFSLFDMGTILQPGMFPKWQDCRDWCGDRYIGRIQR